jgi:hypothetical protein
MRPSTVEVLEPRRLLSAAPAIAISDVALAEGQAGQTAYVFTVSLSNRASKQVSVGFTTLNETAAAGEDFAQTSGTLTFARGQTAKTVTVLVNGDTTVEANETFSLNLRNARNAFISDTRGVGTIVNDDVVLPPPPPPLPPAEEPTADPNDYYTSPGDYYNDYIIEGTGTFY